MHIDTHPGLDSPKGVWWKPAHKAEKTWVAIAFAWCLVLFAMMPLWHWKGGQNPSGVRTRVDPKAFYARPAEFVKQYKGGGGQWRHRRPAARAARLAGRSPGGGRVVLPECLGAAKVLAAIVHYRLRNGGAL